jgi:hypothetical protein
VPEGVADFDDDLVAHRLEQRERAVGDPVDGDLVDAARLREEDMYPSTAEEPGVCRRAYSRTALPLPGSVVIVA